MKRKLSLVTLAVLGALMLAVLSGVPSHNAAHAQNSPSVAVELSSASVTEGTAIAVTMSFGNLAEDSDRATTDYLFRADVLDADGCEEQAGGYGLGVDRKINQVDEDPEVRRGTISAGCPAGDYTVRASISDTNDAELASATADFSVAAPEPPASNDAALSGLALSGVTLEFDPATTTYTAEVGNDAAETTVSPTVNDDRATYAVRLDGAADEDGIIPLSVGGNVISVLVTAEDGETTRTYTVTVTRAEAPPELSDDAALSGLALSGVTLEFDPATTTYAAEVGNDAAETTVSPTVNDDRATYAVRLDGATDKDGTVPLSVGENVISVVVTAEDGETTRTYTVTVTRAEAATSGPTVAIALSPSDTVIEGEGTEIAVTLSFGNLTFDDDRATTDYVFRADVKDSEDGDADGCEEQAGGYGLGVDRKINQVDEDPETRAGSISADCPAGVYTLRASISNADNEELASATAALHVLPPPDVYEVDDPDTALAAVSSRDITLHSANANAYGLWSDTTTVWVSDPSDIRLYAYTLADGTRDTSKEFSLASVNSQGAGIWSNGTTIWVSDAAALQFYAYTLAGGARDSGSDFSMALSVTPSPRGIWSNDTTMWLADPQADKLYAYTLSSGARDTGKDFSLHSDNAQPQGIWSDGSTIWVADSDDDKVYAYTLSNGARVAGRDFDLVAANSGARGIWSNGMIMWVVDKDDRKLYAYDLPRPASTDATLSALTVSPTDIIGFDSDTGSYHVGVANSVTQVTVTATASDSGATIDIGSTTVTSGTGHQVTLSAGLNTVTITVTAGDGSTEQAYTIHIGRGVTADFGWKAVDDFNGLVDAGNTFPLGIWSNGTTMWVTDFTDNTIFAYTRTTKAREPGKEFTLAADNTSPRGIWSDSTTMWVADTTANKIYAYDLATKARDASKDFTTLSDAGNTGPQGIWSDGTTMWVTDSGDDKIYAYDLATKERDAGKDFNTLAAGNTDPTGIWSDSVTMWVADQVDAKIYAYSVATKARDASKEFNTLTAAGNGGPQGMWSDDETMWVAAFGNKKIYSYNMPPSANANLRELSLSGITLNEDFAADRTAYTATATAASTTVTATPSHSAAVAVTGPADADAADGHQVTLADNAVTTITVTVTAQDGATRKVYTVAVTRGSVSSDFGRKATDDFNGLVAAGNTSPYGIWSDDETMWVSDSTDDKIYAYNLATKLRDAGKDFNTLADAGNTNPTAIWSDSTTMWVADNGDDKIYAYNLATKLRDAGKDFNTLSAAGNNAPYGIWSDGETMWVADSSDGKIYAYNLATKERDSGKDFDTLTDAGNTSPRGIWSDRVTMWVADSSDDKIYAYILATKERDSDRDFNTLSAAGNTNPYGIWSDGETMWVADVISNKIYSYNMPPSASADATLSALTVSPTDIIGFAGDTTTYHVGVANSVTQATVTAATNDANATIAWSTTDAGAAAGHQVTLSAGLNTVTITVTAEDTTTEEVYTIVIGRGVTADFGWKATADFNGLRAAGNRSPYGIWSNGATMWVSDEVDDKIYAYNLATTARDAGKDFDTLVAAQNLDARGIWSYDATMWVVDSSDDKIYAYNLATKQRDASKDFNTLADAGNADARGIWSDDVTMWVADSGDDKIYAYSMATKARDASKEFNTLSSAGNTGPRGIWSDDVTMWVADSGDNKIYAYNLATKERETSKDFNTLADGNLNPGGIWSDGATMWVADAGVDKIYSYNMPPSPNANLESISVNGLPVSGVNRADTAYTHTVEFTVRTVTVSARPAHPGASVTRITPADSGGGGGHQVALNADGVTPTDVTITVTAEDGMSTRTYTLSVEFGMPPPPDVSLSDLTVSPANLIRIDGETYYYRVADAVTRVTITATTNDAGATIQIGGTAVASGAGHQVALNPDGVTHTDVTVTVTAEDGTSTRTYTVRVDWAASGDATLRGLTLSGIPFSFNTATESYTLGGNEGVSLSSTTVTPTVNRPAASYSIDGGAANTPRKVNLAFGANTIAIVVTAADESTAITYVITVNRKAPPPGTPLLRELRLVYQPFVEDTFLGTCPVTVSSSGRCYATPGIHHTEFDVDTGTVDVVTVVANAAAEGASVTFNHADFVPDKGGHQVKLAGLGTSPTIEVTVANPGGASTVYKINVARQLSGDTRLGELSVTRTGDGTLSDLEPQFITGWNEATGQPRRARYRATLLFNERDGGAENAVVTVQAKELHAGAALRIDGHVTDTNPDRDVFVFARDDSTEQEFHRLELNVQAENADLYVYELVIVKRYSQGDPPPVLAHVFKGLNDYDLKPSLFVDWRDTQSCDKTYNVATEYVTDTQRGWISHPVTSDGEVLNPGGETYTALPQRTHLWLDSESLEVAFGPATAERRDTTIEVWCGPRPYSYKDADGNEQKANADSREVGKATIEFPDAPPAPPEPTVEPETPTGLAGRLHGNEATLTWDTVAGASGYELSIKVGEDWMLIDPAEFKEKYRLTVVVGEGTATMSPLYDSGFEFRVRAVNDIGASDWSEAATLKD